MGIDVYAKWDGFTEADYEAQLTGFDVTAGAVGYLREAYHGGPYVTAWLMPEGFLIAGEYEQAAAWLGGGSEALIDSITGALAQGGAVVDFPRLVESADGFPPLGYLVECETISEPNPKYPDELDERAAIPAAILRRRLPLCEALNERRYPDYHAQVNESYRGFVALYERLEAEGKRPGVYVSY